MPEPLDHLTNDFLATGGEMGRLMYRHDWRQSPLGHPSSWPQSLRTTVGLMLPSAAQIVLFWGPDYVALYNDAYAPSIGKKHPVALGNPAVDNWAELWDDLEPLLRSVRETRQTVHAKDRPFYIDRHGYGEHVYFDISYSAVPDQHGGVGGVLCIVSETTERVKTERAMKESERELQLLADTLPALIGYIDNQRRYRFVNKAYREWFPERWNRGVLDRTIADVVGQHAYEKVRPHVDKVLSGEAVTFEHRAPILDRERLMRVDYVPRRADDGRIEGFYWLVQDISEQKRIEAALVESEGKLREANAQLEERFAAALAERNLLATIVETTGTQVQVLDTKYRWLAINDACISEFQRVYGKVPRVGDSLIDLLADLPEELATVKAMWDRVFAGEAYSTTERFGDPQLEQRYYETKFEVLRDADGGQTGAFLSGHDVTDRVNEQRRLAEAEDALIHSQKMEAMGQLTGGVAHDFNNLLTPIIGALDRLQRQGLGNEREQKLIDGAVLSAERAKTLVQRLLSFARRQPLQRTAVDLPGLVMGMADLISSTTGPQIEVTVSAPATLPAADADPNQLEMALLNLCVNARDAMPDGGTLRISLSAQVIDGENPAKLKPGKYVCLSVADTGAGMDEETVRRSIEPFFSTKGIGRGTGLGLSMVHGLAAQLGGALTIHSKPGLGTNAQLWLPQSTARSEPAKDEQVEIETTDARGVALVVDDEMLVREATAEMILDLGYQVQCAGSAEEALKLIEQGLHPSLLVTDHLMPGMTGTDLARAVSASVPGIGILIVSGYANVESIAPDLPRLSKPFRQNDLAAKLAEISQR